MTLSESRKLLGIVGLGSSLPTLTCTECHSVALFDAGSDSESWRIKYKSVNRSPRFYYVLIHLGQAGWLAADQALEISLNGYVQRQRIQQVQRGDFSWLRLYTLESPPPLMSHDEVIYLSAEEATFQQTPRSTGVLTQGDETVLDSGKFYVTDYKLHLLGQRRDWAHRLSDIQRVEHTDQYWRIYVGETGQHYQGMNSFNQMDAQLFATVVKSLWKNNRESDSESESDDSEF